MLPQSATRALIAMALMAAPVAAQTSLGPYAPMAAKYRITSSTRTSQTMMGQAQEFESRTNQLASLSVEKAGESLVLSMVLDSATATTTAPDGGPDLSDAIGLKLVGRMAPDGKVASSEVTDRSGAPSKSPIAGNMRSILPRLQLGASPGARWVDSNTSVTKQDDSEVTSTTMVAYTLAGDTTVAGARAWKILGASTGKLSGAGNRMGADYTIAGDVQGNSMSLVSLSGVLLAITSDDVTNITVTVASAGMTIPILQKTTTTVERLP